MFEKQIISLTKKDKFCRVYATEGLKGIRIDSKLNPIHKLTCIRFENNSSSTRWSRDWKAPSWILVMLFRSMVSMESRGKCSKTFLLISVIWFSWSDKNFSIGRCEKACGSNVTIELWFKYIFSKVVEFPKAYGCILSILAYSTWKFNYIN